MKYLVLLIAVTVVTAKFNEKQLKKLVQIHRECASEQNITKETLQSFIETDSTDDSTAHCYVKCIVQKTSFYDDETGFSEDNFAKYVANTTHKTEQQAREALNICKIESEVHKNDKCQCKYVYEVIKCLRKLHVNVVKTGHSGGKHRHSKHKDRHYKVHGHHHHHEHKIDKETLEKLHHKYDKCCQENNITIEQVETFKKLDFSEDKDYHCYMKCMAIKMNGYDEEHGFMVENFVKHVTFNGHKTEDEVQTAMNECKTEVEQYLDDKCKYVYEALKCLKKLNIQIFNRHHREHHQHKKHHNHEHHDHKDHHKDHPHKDHEHHEHNGHNYKEHDHDHKSEETSQI